MSNVFDILIAILIESRTSLLKFFKKKRESNSSCVNDSGRTKEVEKTTGEDNLVNDPTQQKYT